MQIAELVLKYMLATAILVSVWHTALTIIRAQKERFNSELADRLGEVKKAIDNELKDAHRGVRELKETLRADLPSLRDSVSSVYDAIKAAEAQSHARVNVIEEKLKAVDHDTSSFALAIKNLSERIDRYSDLLGDVRTAQNQDKLAITELIGRCDKNSKAIENTAASMQQTLNEKFAGAALRGAFNPPGVNR